MSRSPNSRTADGLQLTFDELDTPLRETTFVVVDLETTGGSSESDAITEIGAVKVRGGEVLGELGTLVDPGRAIPPYIVELTGITTAMVRTAPRIDTVLPAFLEFAGGAVLVAHNAGFDVGFLKAAAARQGLPWPKFQVLCTVKLARRVLGRDEAPSVKLSALAALLGRTPHRRTGRSTTPGPPSTYCTRSSGGSATRACTACRNFSTTCRACRRNNAPNAPWRATFRGRRACTCSAGRRTRCSTWGPRRICDDACATTSPDPRLADG